MSWTRSALCLAATAALLASGCSVQVGERTAPTRSADYQRAYDIGTQAYLYGLPLLTTDATFQTMTSTNVSQGAYGPVNQFNNVRSPNGASSTAVVAPGSTSLSSIAWLDLTDGPQVLHVPQVTGHFFVLALLDPYTENLVNLGSASATAPGDYVVATPDQAGDATPQGAQRIEVDYPRIWIIGSTQLKGADDVAAVNAIQDEYTLTPLSAYGTDYTPPAPSDPVVTITKHTIPTGIAFFDQLGALLAQFPPPAADAPALASFATVGIGPGLTPSDDAALSSDTLDGLAAAAADGAQEIRSQTESLYAADAPTHAGYLLGGFGRYGTDYAERAVISQIGLGAFVPQQAVYAMAWSDSSGTALTGSSSYVLHLASPPPTQEGWSLTVYTLSGQLVANPSGHYGITNISPLVRNADGSIDLYLQADAPSDSALAANWVATPAGAGFEVTWRLFAPDAASVPTILSGSGWQPPAIAAA